MTSMLAAPKPTSRNTLLADSRIASRLPVLSAATFMDVPSVSASWLAAGGASGEVQGIGRELAGSRFERVGRPQLIMFRANQVDARIKKFLVGIQHIQRRAFTYRSFIPHTLGSHLLGLDLAVDGCQPRIGGLIILPGIDRIQLGLTLGIQQLIAACVCALFCSVLLRIQLTTL